MIVDAINKILSLSEPYRENIHGLHYTTGSLNLIVPPKISQIEVVTLSALVDLYKTDFENITKLAPLFHVTTETEVEVFGQYSNDYAQRTRFVKAKVKESSGFPFGEWLTQEAFIIKTQTHLIANPDREYLLKVTSCVSDIQNLKIEDNGVTQDVTVKAGTSLNSEVTLKPRVTLKPYRTFRDVEQPESDFIFRVRKGQQGPQFALFEADGGEWKLKAMETIARFLDLQLMDKDGKAPTVIY